MLFPSVISTSCTGGYKTKFNSQKLSCSVLKTDEEVQYDTEKHQRDKGVGDVYERHRDRLDEWVIHRRPKMTEDDWALGE